MGVKMVGKEVDSGIYFKVDTSQDSTRPWTSPRLRQERTLYMSTPSTTAASCWANGTPEYPCSRTDRPNVQWKIYSQENNLAVLLLDVKPRSP